MEWTQVSVTTQSEAVEAVSYILDELGATGVKIDDSKDFDHITAGKYGEHGEIADPATIPHLKTGAKVTAYYPQSVYIPEILPQIKQRVQALASFGLNPDPAIVEASAVDDENWATAWKKYYHPVRVTRHLTIVPSWEDYTVQQNNEIPMYLDPGMAFGTGTHPTTQLMLQALDFVVRGGETMIDVGTGSGVLSIAAKFLGVDEVHAYDVDDVAVRQAVENLKLNPTATNIDVAANDLLNGIDLTVDLIVANILAEIIVPLIPQAWNCLNPGGLFLTSGIIADKKDLIVSELKKQGFRIDEVMRMKDWFGVIAHKPLPDE